MDASRLRLYLVADPDLVEGDLTQVVVEAITGGVTCVQLRVKGRSDRAYEQLAARVAHVCLAGGVLFLVNDRVDIALAVGAGGVHLGVDDLPITAARRLGADSLLIGYSPETDEQAAAARGQGADYLGIGPVFATTSKPDAGSAIGVEGLKSRVAAGGLPTVGIGGIIAANASEVMAAGASGVAVMSAILRAADPAGAARELVSSMARRTE